MKQQTINQLNQINNTFYQEVANDFHRTRQHYWPGWHQLTDLLKQSQPTSILDVGCGNGRFGLYLKHEPQLNSIKYIGLDSNDQLLSLAQKRLTKEEINNQLIQTDLVEQLIQDQPLAQLDSDYDLITAFGLLHHIPSFELRKKLLTQLAGKLTQNGILVITFWRFLDDLRLKKRVVDPSYLNLDPSELDEHDFILDWKRGVTGYRYCHYVDDQEEALLLQDLGLEQLMQFKADGPTNQVNQYLALRKKKE